MLVDGKLIPADSGKTFANINPATEEVIGEVADAILTSTSIIQECGRPIRRPDKPAVGE